MQMRSSAKPVAFSALCTFVTVGVACATPVDRERVGRSASALDDDDSFDASTRGAVDAPPDHVVDSYPEDAVEASPDVVDASASDGPDASTSYVADAGFDAFAVGDVGANDADADPDANGTCMSNCAAGTCTADAGVTTVWATDRFGVSLVPPTPVAITEEYAACFNKYGPTPATPVYDSQGNAITTGTYMSILMNQIGNVRPRGSDTSSCAGHVDACVVPAGPILCDDPHYTQVGAAYVLDSAPTSLGASGLSFDDWKAEVSSYFLADYLQQSDGSFAEMAHGEAVVCKLRFFEHQKLTPDPCISQAFDDMVASGGYAIPDDGDVDYTLITNVFQGAYAAGLDAEDPDCKEPPAKVTQGNGYLPVVALTVPGEQLWWKYKHRETTDLGYLGFCDALPTGNTVNTLAVLGSVSVTLDDGCTGQGVVSFDDPGSGCGCSCYE
jgi:hypothetical protein